MSFFGNFGKYQGHFCCVGDEWEISTSKHTQTMYFHVAQLLCSYLHPLWKNRFLKILKNRHFGSFFTVFLLCFKVIMTYFSIIERNQPGGVFQKLYILKEASLAEIVFSFLDRNFCRNDLKIFLHVKQRSRQKRNFFHVNISKTFFCRRL